MGLSYFYSSSNGSLVVGEFQQEQKVQLDAAFVMVIWGRSVCIIPAGAAGPYFFLGVLGTFQKFTVKAVKQCK